MWKVILLACTVNDPASCHPAASLSQMISLAECQANGAKIVSHFEAHNPRLKVRAWKCRVDLKGAVS
jgi:hypothetical protein